MKIGRTETLTRFKHLNLIQTHYQDRLDNPKTWIYATRTNGTPPDAVVVVPYHVTENKLVLIKEFRVPLQGIQVGFPAGLVDKGESIEQAGTRELKEETGLGVSKVLKVSPPIYSSSGMTDESISLLYVECTGSPSSDFNEASEQIEVVMVSPEEARELMARTDLKFDVKTWIVLTHFAETGNVE